MKIGYIYDALYPYSKGGVEKRIWELSRLLAQKGHEVHVFAPKYWEGNSVRSIDGVFLHGVCATTINRFENGRRSILWPIYFAILLFPHILREKCDIIDCQNFPYFPCFSAKFASIINKSRLVITWIEVWGNYWYIYLGWKGFFGKFIEKVVASLSSNAVAISSLTKKQLSTINNKLDVRVIPLGVYFEEIKEIEPSIQKSDIIFVGRFINEKNIPLLIRALNIISESGQDINAILIGDGPEHAYCQNLVSELRLGDHIKLTGRIEDDNIVYSYMKAAKVFVIPSTREGFGLVAVEANACGLPVIACRHEHNAICDLILDGRNGFLCSIDEKDLADKIMRALSVWDIMTGQCINYGKGYDWAEIAKDIESYYRIICQ